MDNLSLIQTMPIQFHNTGLNNQILKHPAILRS
jgi:hypothetical protein